MFIEKSNIRRKIKTKTFWTDSYCPPNLKLLSVNSSFFSPKHWSNSSGRHSWRTTRLKIPGYSPISEREGESTSDRSASAFRLHPSIATWESEEIEFPSVCPRPENGLGRNAKSTDKLFGANIRHYLKLEKQFAGKFQLANLSYEVKFWNMLSVL